MVPSACPRSSAGTLMRVDACVSLTDGCVVYSAELTYGKVVVRFGGFRCSKNVAHTRLNGYGWQIEDKNIVCLVESY